MKWKMYKKLLGVIRKDVAAMGGTKEQTHKLGVVRLVGLFGPQKGQSIEFLTGVDEVQYENQGSHTMFLESEALVTMLMKARIKLDNTPLRMPYGAMVVCPPAGMEFRGHEIPSFLAVDMRPVYRNKTIAYINKIAGVNMERKGDDRYSAGIAILVNAGQEYTRVAIPPELFSAVAESSPENISTVLPMFESASRGMEPVEQARTYNAFRLLAAMLAYMEARPELVVQGLPHDVAPHDFPDRDTDFGTKAVTGVKAPAGLRTSGGGGKKSSHLRSWFFRRYPIKKDMTRRPGMIFIEETVVNEDMDPQTVTKEKVK